MASQRAREFLVGALFYSVQDASFVFCFLFFVFLRNFLFIYAVQFNGMGIHPRPFGFYMWGYLHCSRLVLPVGGPYE